MFERFTDIMPKSDQETPEVTLSKSGHAIYLNGKAGDLVGWEKTCCAIFWDEENKEIGLWMFGSGGGRGSMAKITRRNGGKCRGVAIYAKAFFQTYNLLKYCEDIGSRSLPLTPRPMPPFDKDFYVVSLRAE